MSEDGLDPGTFREVLGHFATGVTVVTALTELPVGFTCQAFSSLGLEPPSVVLAASKASTSWPRIRGVGLFCVNVLSEDQKALARSFSVSGGEKFGGVTWEPAPKTRSPILEGAAAWIECHLDRVFDMGDHELATARVLALGGSDKAPLVFHRGRFGTIAYS
ncbi:MAG: flavin reductase family protein [Acidimicrobiales bacterium]